ncbi:MAG: MmcQ/YjbR family DNA-binding protein [Caulobacteraceae bacterium]
MTPDALRSFVLSMPEAIEQDHHGSPSFRVRGKIFCTVKPDGSRLMVKLAGEDQHNFVEAHPGTITPVPGYWGKKGSTLVNMSEAPVGLIEPLLELAWRTAAPKALLRRS